MQITQTKAERLARILNRRETHRVAVEAALIFSGIDEWTVRVSEPVGRLKFPRSTGGQIDVRVTPGKDLTYQLAQINTAVYRATGIDLWL